MRPVVGPIFGNVIDRPVDIVDTTQSFISCHMINSDQTAAGLLVIMACTEGGLDVPGQIEYGHA